MQKESLECPGHVKCKFLAWSSELCMNYSLPSIPTLSLITSVFHDSHTGLAVTSVPNELFPTKEILSLFLPALNSLPQSLPIADSFLFFRPQLK